MRTVDPPGTCAPLMVPFAAPSAPGPGPETIRLRARCARQGLVIGELSHRLRNTLALTQAMVAQTLREPMTLDEAREVLVQRIVALGRAHAALAAGMGRGGGVGNVVGAALAAHGHGTPRFLVNGPAIRIDARRALALSMALHELATNAAKHGALSCAGGRVVVTWTVEAHAGARRVRFLWEERGGPAAARAPEGFGLSLIRRATAIEPDEGASLRFEAEGLCCEIVISACRPGKGGSGTAAGRPPVGP